MIHNNDKLSTQDLIAGLRDQGYASRDLPVGAVVGLSPISISYDMPATLAHRAEHEFSQATVTKGASENFTRALDGEMYCYVVKTYSSDIGPVVEVLIGEELHTVDRSSVYDFYEDDAEAAPLELNDEG
jgi:hypothetical protein